MNVLLFLIPLSLLLGAFFFFFFIFAVKNGQYYDLDTPAEKIIVEYD
mgnify:CR=1 FL=1